MRTTSEIRGDLDTTTRNEAWARLAKRYDLVKVYERQRSELIGELSDAQESAVRARHQD